MWKHFFVQKYFFVNQLYRKSFSEKIDRKWSAIIMIHLFWFSFICILDRISTISVSSLSLAQSIAVLWMIFFHKFHILFEILIQLKKVIFEFHESVIFKMSLILISISLCCNNNSIISLWPSDAAQINTVLFNVRVKFHKSFKIKIQWKKSKIWIL